MLLLVDVTMQWTVIRRWERVELAYRAIVDGVGQTAESATAGILASYEEDVV